MNEIGSTLLALSPFFVAILWVAATNRKAH